MNTTLHERQATPQTSSLTRSYTHLLQGERGTPGRQLAYEASSLRRSEGQHKKQETSGISQLLGGRGTAWDFSRIPIHSPEEISGSDHTSATPAPRPRIDFSGISFQHSEQARGSVPRDGSPDDLEQMEDQDALVPSVFEPGRGGRGVHIRVPGGNPGGTTEYPDGIRWVQTIETNAPLFGQSSPYVDFIPPRDDKPFYFADGRENATFSDNPRRRANDVRWDATLSLVGVRGRVITRFDSVKYGFDIDGSGTLSLHGPSALGPGALIIHSDTFRSEHSDWAFSGGFTVPDLPSTNVDTLA